MKVCATCSGPVWYSYKTRTYFHDTLPTRLATIAREVRDATETYSPRRAPAADSAPTPRSKVKRRTRTVHVGRHKPL